MADKIPLKSRKAIKEAFPKVEAELARASQAIGVTLSWVENTGELFFALESRGENLGPELPKYFTELVNTFTEFAKNEVRKEALQEALNQVGGKVKIVTVGSSETDRYYSWSADELRMEVKASYWGSYLSYFNAGYLEASLNVTYFDVKMPLEVKRKIVAAIPDVNNHIKRASDNYGAELTWEVDYGKLVTFVGEYKAKELDTHLPAYAKQFADAFSEFVNADPDNKEAIQEAFTANIVSFHLADNSENDKYWIWQDGKLLLQVKAGYFGSYLSYYNGGNLESTL
jgi:hypothetical protein